MNVYVNNSELENAYIGEWRYCYTPTSNTKVYCPFVDSQLDITWNTSIDKTLTKQNKWYSFVWNSNDCSFTNHLWIRFYCYWMYCNSLPTNKYVRVLPTDYWYMHFIPTDSTTSRAQNVVYIMWNSSTSPYSNSWYYSWKKTMTLWQWNHMAYWIDSSNNFIWMLNWATMWSWNQSWTPFHNTSILSNLFWWNDNFTITLLDVIWEDRVWTSAEIQAYYNKSKAFYWL